MKRSVIVAAAIVAIASSTGALAQDVTDTIKNVDKKADTITLMSGKVLRLPEQIEVERFRAGEKVKVHYFTSKTGRATVSSIHTLM